MYAVIRAGGKQYKVAKGDVIEIELAKGRNSIEFVPLLIVDDKGKARSAKDELSKARVVATVLGETKGDKLEVYKFRSKTGYRRHAGHRQRYTSVQIEDIKLTGGKALAAAASKTEPKAASKTEPVADTKPDEEGTSDGT